MKAKYRERERRRFIQRQQERKRRIQAAPQVREFEYCGFRYLATTVFDPKTLKVRPVAPGLSVRLMAEAALAAKNGQCSQCGRGRTR